MISRSSLQGLRLLRLATHMESWASGSLKQEALKYLSMSAWAALPAAALWDEIAGAFVCSAPNKPPRPYNEYSGTPADEDPFDCGRPRTSQLGGPLGYEFRASPGFKPVNHLSAALTQLQLGATSSDLLLSSKVLCLSPIPPSRSRYPGLRSR